MSGKTCLIFLLSSLVILCQAIVVRDEVYYNSREAQSDDEHSLTSQSNDARALTGQNFHEVDAFGDDFVDFGAQTGPHGAFTWHANFPLEEKR
uniref:Secreted protein n=1 Tax=Anopheles farauti TaxID=69004 RepID=A0A182QJH1_9DIPT